jgi:hypothetical protein
MTLWFLSGSAAFERAGWSPDGTEKTDDVAGVPAVEARYRRAL